ncbi:hypothetical protein ABTK16_20650, partial [Acinetobacter baumannii]
VQRDGDHAVFVSVPRRSAAELLSPVSERGPGDPPAALRGLRGDTGSGLVRDDAGVEVLASWSRLPSLDWGIAITLD